jgi:hypothetical protein
MEINLFLINFFYIIVKFLYPKQILFKFCCRVDLLSRSNQDKKSLK